MLGLTVSKRSKTNFWRAGIVTGFFSLWCFFGTAVPAVEASPTDGTIDATYRYAWGENIGWVDFGSSTDAVHVTASALTGSAYGENIGWLVLDPEGYGGVTNDGEGNLAGEAWGENIGWVDFSQVTIGTDGVFAGQAYGENIGWITFGTTTNKVVTDWRASSGGQIFTISGVLYESDRTTPQVATTTVTLALVATTTLATYSTTTELTTGAFAFNIDIGELVSTSTPVTLYVNGNTSIKAVTVTKTNGSSTITNLDLYQNHVIISHEATSGTSTTNTDLAQYDTDNDSDIPFTANSGTLAIQRGYELFIKPGKTFAPGGPVSASSSLTIASGATYDAPATTTINGTFSNQGTFTENGGTLTMDGIYTDVLNYVAGSDASGDSSGTSVENVFALTTSGQYLYLGKDADATACSQTAGSAIGCELMVFDISSSTNPVYVAGRDASGDSGGTGLVGIRSLITVGDYLYLGKNADATACSQTAGLATGCELMVFDIASSTNPVYVAGRDASGDSGGTGVEITYALTTSGQYLYLGKDADATACSQTAGSAIGCELMVFDISSTTNPVYVAGRDASGDSGGTGSKTIYALTTSGQYLYLGKLNDATACSQTAGSAIGCELMVFDISSTTNPVYVAGRDASGDSGGTGSVSIYSFTTYGDYLYLGKNFNITACSQTAGSAIGCELMVFDISSSTNPVYVAGRDVSGDSSGIKGQLAIYAITTSGYHLIIGKTNGTRDSSEVPCSQTAGSAIGCDLMTFDISSTTNPIYVAGRDVSGDSSGTGSKTIYALTTSGQYLYLGKQNDATACSQTAGSAIGCELMVFNANPADGAVLLGTLTAESALGDTVAQGTVRFIDTASTTNLTINSGATVVAPATVLSIAGNYTNNGTFTHNSGTTTLSGTSAQTATGTMTGTSAFNHLSLTGAGVKTFGTNASTSNFVVNSGATAVAPAELSVSGHYLNNGTTTMAGATWTDRNVTSAKAWTSVTYGNGLFVAVNNNSSATAAVMTSPDGITWTDRNVPSAKSWISVTYGNGLFVAVNYDGSATAAVMTSPDGITWTDRNVPSAKGWISVTYGNGLFVAVNGDGSATAAVMTSPDGITWTDRNVPSAKSWRSVTYGNGLFVAVNGNNSATAAVMTSSDGITWTDRNVPSAKALESVTYGNGLFVAVCVYNEFYLESDSLMTSPDGIIWTERNVPSAKYWIGVTYGNGLFVALNNDGSATSAVMTSPDGITWTDRNVPSAKQWTSVTYGNGRFMAVNGDVSATAAVMTSDVSTITFTGASAQSIGGSLTGASALGNVAFTGAGIKTFGANASTTNFVVNSGATAVAPASLTIAGDYQNNGTFTAGSGTTTFIGGTAQVATGTMTGTSAFNNLDIRNTHTSTSTTFGNNVTVSGNLTNNILGSKLAFAPGITATTTTLTITGSSTATTSLRSTTVGSQFNLAVTGSYNLSYIEVQDSNACRSVGGEIDVIGDNVTDSGNNTCWKFVIDPNDFLTVSGVLYETNRTTPQVATTTVTLALIATSTLATFSTTTELTTGAFAFNIEIGQLVATSTPVTLYVNGNASIKAVTVTKTSGTTTIANLDLYQNHVIVSHEATSGTSTTNTDLAQYDTDNDSDVPFTANSGTLAIQRGYELFIKPGKTFAPGGPVSASSSLTIASGATYDAPAATTTINGTLSNQGTFTENGGTLTMDGIYTDVLSYLAGRDVSGDSSGTGLEFIYALTTAGNYLYLGKSSDATACSQTAGSAIGCELMVFDISSSSNPVYVAGRDVSGDSSGTGSLTVYSLTTLGNYLYVGKSSNATACSQTAGSAIGCELMVFDISSTTNPIYVAGRDASGDSGGTGSANIYSLITAGNYLYLGKQGNVTACSQTAGSAIGCELMVFDISSTTNPVYVAGRDASGDSGGTDAEHNLALTISGQYLYLGKDPNITACSQTAGSAIGCELMVFDISSTTNPVYVAGRDVSGDSGGTGSGYIYALTTAGNYLYVGKSNSATACSQTAGSAIGCELMVFDISSSSNPVYVAGRDVSGDSGGTGSGYIYALTTAGHYLYLGKNGISTACSQTAGSAIGCELMVFDISSSSNPVYVAGRDVSGNSDLGKKNIYALTIAGDYLYVGKQSDATACSQTAGSATGCELMVFNANPADGGVVLGTLTAESALGDTVTQGNVRFIDTSSTTNLTIVSGTTTLTSSITVSGNLYNQATLEALVDSTQYYAGNYTNTGTIMAGGTIQVFASDSTQTLVGTLNGTSAFSNLTFTGSGAKTVSAAASTTGTFTIESGASVTADEPLSVAGVFANAGTFNAPATLTVHDNYTNTGTFDANSGVIELKTYITNYLQGRDVSGDSGGTGAQNIIALTTVGNYLYVGKQGDATACSQVVGSASGCELMVFDISSTTNPLYVAGRDASGDSGGTGSLTVYSLTTLGNYLYLGKEGSSATACEQTAGSAIGCELMVFDISSSSNPVYVAGRDVSGDSGGTAEYVAIYSLTTVGNYLYVGKQGDATACSQVVGSASGCELMVFDISSSSNPVYVAGRDASGDSGGTGSLTVYSLTTVGNYLYVGKDADATACSQTAGSAIGCELMVFDISSTTNPIYVAGRDATGDSSGTGLLTTYSLTTAGNYLYLGKGGSATACSQTAGSAIGCELMVFDISSSTNPVYVAGRDASGDSGGTDAEHNLALTISGQYLYLGKDPNITACSQTAGSAIGCELMVFDISSSSNPVYVAGRDATGDSGGTENGIIYALTTAGNYLYLGKSFDATACSQTAGSAIGCELMVMGLHTLSGTLTGSSALADVSMTGVGAHFLANASTTNLTLATSSTLIAEDNLSVSDTLTAYGSTTLTLGANATTTVNILNLFGTASSTITLNSTDSGTQANFVLSGSSTVTYTTIADSDACGSTGGAIDVSSGNNTNGGNTDCWTFTAATGTPALALAQSYTFYAGEATTTIGTITITEASEVPGITTATDIRLTIATTTTNFRFDTTDTTPTFGGTASGKVSGTVSYPDGGATLLIDVTTNFAASDTLTIAGLSVGSFASVSTTTSQLQIHTDGNSTGTPAALSTETFRITGLLTVSDHPEDQVNNRFSFMNRTEEPVFRFTLTPTGETATITDMVLTLSGVQNLTPEELINLKLYRDTNSDGLFDGGDTLIDSNGILTINGQHGAVTWSTDFLATTSLDYLIIADTVGIDFDDAIVFLLPTTGITATGQTSNYQPTISSTVSDIQHSRFRSGGGKSNADRIGGAAPAGGSVETGGESGGGDQTGEEPEGENIVADPDFRQPTNTGTPDNQWTNPTNAYNSDGVYATASSTNFSQSYYNFGFGIPQGNAISGIAVKLDASGNTANGTIDVALSWNNGGSYTTAKATPTLSDGDIVYTVGGVGDTWGRNWSQSEFENGTFILRIKAEPSSNTLRLDALEVRVHHQATGGGSGGGGRS